MRGGTSIEAPRSEPSDESIRVLRLLRELHARGYERLRLHCGWSPNGMAWRYGIAPSSQSERAGLRMKPERYPGRPFRSTRGEGPPFGLPGTERAATEESATAFVRRFRGVALEGCGPDPADAAWFEDLLGTCEPDGIPVMYADAFDAGEHGIMVEGADAPFRLPSPIPRA